MKVSALTFAVQSFVTLFVIMDPPGATPIFLALVADKSPKERRVLAIKAASVSLLVISIFCTLWSLYFELSQCFNCSDASGRRSLAFAYFFRSFNWR